jgi:hypothetical protein
VKVAGETLYLGWKLVVCIIEVYGSLSMLTMVVHRFFVAQSMSIELVEEMGVVV